jgi:hypothetical protein
MRLRKVLKVPARRAEHPGRRADVIRNPTPPPARGADETADARTARIEAMRKAYLAGTLELEVPDDENGLRRLLRDVFSGGSR